MSCIKGVSVYLPEKIVTNDDIVEKFPEWSSHKILEKIGVKQRFIASENEFSSDMAVRAVNRLLVEYQIDKTEIDFLIVCTQSPDYLLPTTACLVQEQVGLSTTCGAIDINQGCSGYIYGLSLANGLIASGNFKNVILVTTDTYSKYIHPTDKGNISIFGDAATATLISTQGDYQIGKFTLGTDGSGKENLLVKNSGTRYNKSNNTDDLDDYLNMKGKNIFAFVMRYVPPVLIENIKINNLKINDIDLFIFHQANTFILENLRREMQIPSEKFVIEMLNFGNTVSSTIPIALKEHLTKYPEKPSNILQLAGFGVGYSWGAVCLFKK